MVRQECQTYQLPVFDAMLSSVFAPLPTTGF
jgi:hypothetical protein